MLVLIRFLDGEILRAEVDEITFDRTLLEAEVSGADPNNERALFPLTAIRQVIIGHPEPVPPDVAGWDRAAFHFVDGQVMRASVAADSRLGRYGGVWRLVEADAPELRTVAIPYSALKGVFKLRQWDSRPLSTRAGGEERPGAVARILAERDDTRRPAHDRRAPGTRHRR